MSHTITVRVTEELARWVKDLAAASGREEEEVIRDQLEFAKASSHDKAFWRLAGAIDGPSDLSTRRGFSME
jgi:predicted transcriptional regulator